ncbi:roadblock/LC7 domain-containing protein [Methanoregula sp.]|jgi:predicted regulator of Ras-like GTPase activity (Roadblock/LC7/MglB family)|uniref:roadblock/LC7 domain-containing protein n=1 Tax=Methanoregula sp. TaxID=2052170 RepID=UPI003C792018
MKLPAGRQEGVVIDPKKEDVIQYLKVFRGAIEITTIRGKGFILIRDGELIAAFFEDKESVYRADAAVRYIMDNPANDGDSHHQQHFVMRSYNEEEYAESLKICTQGRLLMESLPMEKSTPPLSHKSQEHSLDHTSPRVDESILNKLMCQPGVIAVSAFYEGFPVLSLGEADFEHVAARAEDFVRTGTKIAQDMNLGQPGQLILETEENKFIIVPWGDLFLCIITRADAQLGLMRVLIRSIQNMVNREN